MRYKKSVFRSLAMVTQLGLCVLTPVLLAVMAGNYLDSRFGVKTVLPLLVLGVLGGGRGAYMMAKRLIDQDAREEKAEQERRRQEVLDRPQTVSRPKQPSRIFRENSQAEPGTEDSDGRYGSKRDGSLRHPLDKEADS